MQRLSIESRKENDKLLTSEVQLWLNRFRPILADGDFGEKTKSAVIDAQNQALSLGLNIGNAKPDGVIGSKTWGAFFQMGLELSTMEAPLDTDHSNLKPPSKLSVAQKQTMFGPLICEPVPDSAFGAVHITNDFAKKIEWVHVPQLVGVIGGPPNGKIQFHKSGAEQLRGFFQDIDDAGLKNLLLSFSGSYVARYIRGSTTTLSSHAFGTAFDINAPQNWLGTRPAAANEYGTVIPLLPAAYARGFYWGGLFKGRKDGMHFEMAKIQP